MFPALVSADKDYSIEFTGTSFNKMAYTLKAKEGQSMKVRILKQHAGSYQVKANGRVIEPNTFDENFGTQAALTRVKGCGENRQIVGSDSYIEFILTPLCEVFTEPITSIKANVRLDWTLDEFYASGGTTSFADRVCAALGIHASRLKVVAVYRGSVIVDFFIDAES